MFTVSQPLPPPAIIPSRSNNYARPPSPSSHPATDKWTSSSREYILMRKDQVQELTSMEQLLATEKTLLSRQCALLFSDSRMSSRIPVPVARMAVTDVCRAEMREARALLRIATSANGGAGGAAGGGGAGNSGGGQNSGKNGSSVGSGARVVDTSRGGRSSFEETRIVTTKTLKGGYVTKQTVWPNRTLATLDVAALSKQPLATRGTWFLGQRQAAERELARFERETMMMEETVQRLAWRYIEAKNRMEDYEQYYELAVRYGALSEPDFHAHPMPGAVYLSRATKGARSWQRMWWARWPPRRMWMVICATRMQALWRGVKARKRWKPIVKMRLHHGRYAKLLRRLNPWKEYARKMKRANKLMKHILQGAIRVHFGGWKVYVQGESGRRQDVAKTAMRRFLMRREFSVFSAWFSFVERKKKVMTMMKRVIGAPSFGCWVEYVEMIKEQKMCIRSFTKIQAITRAQSARFEYGRLLGLMHVMRKLVRSKKAVNFVGAALAAMVDDHEEKRRDQELAGAVGEEEVRLAAFKVEFDKVESGIRKMKTLQLKTKKGKKELAALQESIFLKYNERKKFPKKDASGETIEEKKVTMQDASDIARARLLNAACDQARGQMLHDFESKRPPKIKSCDPADPKVFIYEEHYLNACPDFADIDLCLKNAKGHSLFSTYVDRIHGVGGEKSSVDFWRRVAEWKRTGSGEEEYMAGAVAIFGDHLDANAGRPARVDEEMRERIGVEFTERGANERGGQKQKGIIGGFLTRFRKGKEATLKAGVFDDAVFSVVLFLKEQCWPGFKSSNLGAEYDEYLERTKSEAREKRVASYLVEKRTKAIEEARGIKVELKNMKEVTERHRTLIMQAQEVATELALEDLVAEAVDEHCKEEEARAMGRERAEAAAVENLVVMFMKTLESDLCDELVGGAVDVVASEKVKALVEQRAKIAVKVLLEDGDFLEALLDGWFEKRLDQWMLDGDHLSPQEKEEERAAALVQARARGLLARVHSRRMAAERFVRRYDEWAREYYWLDKHNQATAWNQPCKFLWKAVDQSAVRRRPPPAGPPGAEAVMARQNSSTLSATVDGGSWSYDEYGSYEERAEGREGIGGVGGSWDGGEGGEVQWGDDDEAWDDTEGEEGKEGEEEGEEEDEGEDEDEER